jgi:TRAP-type transport system small permease protein
MSVRDGRGGALDYGRLQPFATALDAIDRVARVTLIGMMAAMIVVVSAQVFLRYLFASSIGWADEVSRLAFLWSVFLAIPLGIKEGLHLGIEMLTQRLPENLRHGLARLVDAAGAALMIVVCYQSVIVAWDQWDEKMASVDASAAWFIMAIVVGTALSALHLVWMMVTGKAPISGTVVIE